MHRKIQIFSVIVIMAATPSEADSVDETAKCAATFRVLTSIDPHSPSKSVISLS
jgi:hypothetical protein